MKLFIRLLRALWVFGLIFLSYLVQLGLARLFRRLHVEAETGRETYRLPAWLERRRERVDERNAKRLLAAVLRLRGVYIKLGQVLSIMGGFLPRVYTKELESLQDAVPPCDFSDLEPTFLADFGRPAEDLYEKIESQPIAAASLGQVHRAHLTDGSCVAVKVLYPGIRDIIKVDMRVVRLSVIVYQWFVPVRGIERVHEALVDLLRRETDYENEARMMERMADNFRGARDVLFPKPIPELTTRNILTMTFMEGLKINRVEEMPERGISPHALAVRLVEVFYEQIFVHRLFHADPHPGNFLVVAGRKPTRPKIVVLDFGAVSEVKPELVDGMVDVLHGLFDEDSERLLRGFYAMGFASAQADRDLLEKTVRRYFSKLLRIKDRSPAALMRASPKELEQLADPEVARRELRALMRSVSYPDGWFYVERAAVLLFWLVSQIDPEVDPMRIGFPYVMPLLEKESV